MMHDPIIIIIDGLLKWIAFLLATHCTAPFFLLH